MTIQTDNETYFGFKKVKTAEKSSMVKNVFSSVASKYDIMNDVMSLGIHRIWKRKMIEEITHYNSQLIDVAGGSGDISKLLYQKSAGKLKINLVDINEEMLKEAEKNFIDNGIINKIDISQGDAENLNFEDNRFDYYTIAFGIRNVTNIQNVLNEAYRILAPGGKFICLEFSNVDGEFMSKIYDLYSFKLIPKFGEMVAGDKESYQYLVESIRKFPKADDFKNMIEMAGFEKASYQKLSSGICAIHTGWKI